MKWYWLATLFVLHYRTSSSEISNEYVDKVLARSHRHIEDHISTQQSSDKIPNTRCYMKRNHPEVVEMVKRSSIFDHAVDTMMTEKNCTRHHAEHEIKKRATPRREFNPNILCGRRSFSCFTFNTPYRNFDGSCNNPNSNNADYGVAVRRMERLLPPRYADGVNAPRRSVTGAALPNPRDVSLILHPNVFQSNPSVTYMVVGFGQFLDHDITSTPERNDLQCCNNNNNVDCFPIPLPNNDPFYRQFSVRCLEFGRSVRACNSNPREQINQVSAFIDASQIYGSSVNEQSNLRTFFNGQLASQGNGARLPVDNSAQNCGSPQTPCFKAGDSRVNENPELISLHTLWLREHNRIALNLRNVNPGWNDQILFQESRRLVIAQLEQITYNEYLPAILGVQTMQKFRIFLQDSSYTSYDSSINPSIVNSFATAAYRLHTLINDDILLAGRGTVPLRFNFQNPSLAYQQGNMERLLNGMTIQPPQQFDNWVVESVTDHLFQRPNAAFGTDLVSLNIQRGRDHGLPGYPAFRQLCGLSPVLSFNDLAGIFQNSNLIPQYQNLYRNVEDIDLWSAGVSERPVAGGVVGPTFACIIGAQFNRLLYGDRYFFTHGGQAGSFNPAQLANLRDRRLSNVMCDNGITNAVQPNVFLPAGGANSVQGCPPPTLNFGLWRN